MDLKSIVSTSIMPTDGLPISKSVTVKVTEIEGDPEHKAVLQIVAIYFTTPNTLTLVGEDGQAKTFPTKEAAIKYAEDRSWTVVEEE